MRRLRARWLLALAPVALALLAWGLWLSRDLGVRLAERELAVPSRVYARPLVLVPGAHVSERVVATHLRAAGYRSAAKAPPAVGEYWLGARRWQIGRRGFRYPDGFEPEGVASVELDRAGFVERIAGPDGKPLAALFLDPELLAVLHGSAGQDRRLVPLARIPKPVIDAVLAAEDQRFYEHHGVDWVRLGGALFSNVRARRTVQGGSTLTQQLVKNLYVGSERTLWRKLREAFRAVLLELRHDKAEILEAYLNQIYLGQNGALAIHGVERAAQHYFGKGIEAVTLEEAALLAALIPAPEPLHAAASPGAGAEAPESRAAADARAGAHHAGGRARGGREAGAARARAAAAFARLLLRELAAGRPRRPPRRGRAQRGRTLDLQHARRRLPARGGVRGREGARRARAPPAAPLAREDAARGGAGGARPADGRRARARRRARRGALLVQSRGLGEAPARQPDEADRGGGRALARRATTICSRSPPCSRTSRSRWRCRRACGGR